jgi:DNA-binding NtrC family response regulator
MLLRFHEERVATRIHLAQIASRAVREIDPQLSYQARFLAAKLLYGWTASEPRRVLARIVRGCVLRGLMVNAFTNLLHLFDEANLRGRMETRSGRALFRHGAREFEASAIFLTLSQRLGPAHRWTGRTHVFAPTFALALERNRFRRAAQALRRLDARRSSPYATLAMERRRAAFGEALGAASLGAYAQSGPSVEERRIGAVAVLLRMWEQRDTKRLEEFGSLGSTGSRRAATDELILTTLRGSAPEKDLLDLERLLSQETMWARLLIGCDILARSWGSANDPMRRVRALAQGVDAYEGMRRVFRDTGRREHPVLASFRDAVREAVAHLEPRPRTEALALRRLRRLAFRSRVSPRPSFNRIIDALDALITIGRSESGRSLRRRAVGKIAAMLGARVLFHRVGRRWVSLEPQSRHTLRTTTVRRLARVRRVRAFRVRPRPEFWRLDQRRPRGVLAFPVGDGIACLGRGRVFTRRETAAVRTVLRFLHHRLEEREGPLPPGARVRVPTTPAGEGLIGESRAWRGVVEQVRRVAGSDCGVVLQGETGTGKERVARAIHAASRRSPHEFVAVACGALSPNLVADELFGHMRGAFSGADRSRAGLIARAHRGTLFLDEVADMPVEMQVALLRVLDEKSFRPLGSTAAHPADVRVIAATARDLSEEVGAGRFRADLLHRLDVVRIALPPLRERGQDLALLVDHLLGRTPERACLHRDSLPVLAAHGWPGNVRELDNVLRAAAALSGRREITPELLRTLLAHRPPSARPSLERPLTVRQSAIVRALGREWLSAPDIAQRVGVSARTVNRDLAPLVEGGVLAASGAGRARRYARERAGDAAAR